MLTWQNVDVKENLNFYGMGKDNFYLIPHSALDLYYPTAKTGQTKKTPQHSA